MPEEPVTDGQQSEPTTPRRVRNDLWREIEHIAQEGGYHIPAGSKPRDVLNEALDFSLQLWEDMQIVEDLKLASMICPLCLSPTNLLPVYNSVAPVWIEVGHVGDCPVHKFRDELALARRTRWRQAHGEHGFTLDFLRSILGGEEQRKAVDDWLRIATQFQASTPPRLRFQVSRELPTDLIRDIPLDRGEWTQEARTGYERIYKHLQSRVENKKPTELETLPGSYLNETAGRAALYLVRNMPEPSDVTPLQAKAVFHEVLTGNLEWACQQRDSHFTLYEYAHIALGRRVAQFTEDELGKLREMPWTKTMLLATRNMPISPNRPSHNSSSPELI